MVSGMRDCIVNMPCCGNVGGGDVKDAREQFRKELGVGKVWSKGWGVKETKEGAMVWVG